MVQPAAKPPTPSTPAVTFRVLLLVVLVAVVAAGAVAGWAEWRIRRADGGAGEVDAAARAQAAADEQRLEELALVAARLAQRRDLPLGESDPVEGGEGDEGPRPEEIALQLLEEVLDERQLDLAVVTREPGGALAAGAGAPDAAARALAASDLPRRALAQGRARGAWAFDGRLYQVAAERVERDFETVGTVAVADLVGRGTALSASRLSRADAVYLVRDEERGVTAVASTLDRDAGEGLEAALGSAGVLDPALREGERSRPVTLPLGGMVYRAVVAPLRSAAGGPVAARVTLAAAGGDGRLLRMVQAAAVAGLLAALLLGVLAAPALTRGAGAPAREVLAAAEAAVAGDLAGAARHAIPPALAAFFRDAAEKRALEAVVAAAVREGVATAGDPPAERRRGAVLVVEMPRYGRSGADDEPRDVTRRLERDLATVRRAAGARGGRVEGSLGHRALAVFAGERAAARALGAASELLRALSEPENAFDEPVPPALAIAAGTLVLGGPEAARAVAGLPVQQAESLLREASSGDLILSRGVHRELQDDLASGGVEVPAQRGLLTSQPVYLLDAGQAARAAAVLGTAGGEAATGLARLAAGSTLSDRFHLVERVETGSAWSVFTAHDRETGSPVTVKALRGELVAGPEGRHARDGEVRGVLRVVHPAVARVVDLGVSEEVPFLAAELADGPTLARVLARRRPVDAAAALRVARWLAAALEAIHGAGLAHGAVRPEAVALDPRGHARLTDLGSALLLPPPGVDPALDRALGSPRYLAPERLAGGPPTPAADLYAAGALLAELFTGRPLYGTSSGGASEEEDSARLRERIAAGPPEPPDPTELPDGLAPVLARCLERAPSARFADGGELARALAPIRADLVL